MDDASHNSMQGTAMGVGHVIPVDHAMSPESWVHRRDGALAIQLVRVVGGSV